LAEPVLTSSEKQTVGAKPISESDEISDESASTEEEKPVSKSYRSLKLYASTGIRTDIVTVPDPTLIHQRENQPLYKVQRGIAGDKFTHVHEPRGVERAMVRLYSKWISAQSENFKFTISTSKYFILEKKLQTSQTRKVNQSK
jgi:hypothetical protein